MHIGALVMAAVLFPLTPTSVADSGAALTPESAVTARKLLPTDCRLVRGFTHAPIDGRIDTRHSKGSIFEWVGYHGVPAINYREYNDNNGLHIILPDEPFNAVMIRGGWSGRAYLDMTGYDAPTNEAPSLLEATGGQAIQYFLFDEPIRGKRVSFFCSEQIVKPLADVTFLMLTDSAPASLPKAAGEGAGMGQLQLQKGQPASATHEAVDVSQGIAAVTVSFRIDEAIAPTQLRIAVRDTLDARRNIMDSAFIINEPGTYTVTLDTPDQVFLPTDHNNESARMAGPFAPPPALHVAFEANGQLNLQDITLTPHTVDRAVALSEAGAWRKLMVKGIFSSYSEPRPWMHLNDKSPVRTQIQSSAALEKYVDALTEVLENIEAAHLLLPEDPMVSQYHAWVYQNMDRRKPQPPPTIDQVPGAPQWATLARQSYRELALVAQWWLDNRLMPGGLLGGGAQDDTDLFQTWQCLPMIESSPLGDALRQTAEDLGDFAWEHKLEEGINRKTNDALHAYEEGVNQIALNAWWFYGDPVHFERAMTTARTTMKLMIETADGRVHFGGHDVGIDQVRNGFEEITTTTKYGYTWLFLHPMYEVAMYNRNPAVMKRFEQWGRTWADYQKPGAYVDRVHINSGEPVKINDVPRGPTQEWLALYQLTGDARWLDPLIVGMQNESYWGFNAPYGRLVQATIDWPSPWQEKMAAQFRSDRAGYAAFFLNKDRRWINQQLLDSASWFGRYRTMHTEAEQKTDRVLNYQASVPIACYLGDAPNRNQWVRANAVSYEGLRGEDFAALVWDAGPDRLRVALYNFRDETIKGTMRTWRLDNGKYRVRVGQDTDDDGSLDNVTEENESHLYRYAPLSLTLPPGQVTVIDIQQIERLDDLRSRADLAVSPRSTTLTADGELKVRVHNIGARPAGPVQVRLVRGDQTIAEQTIPQIAPPLDLIPRTVDLVFKSAQPGDTLLIDPEQQIEEIAEHNNTLTVTK